MPASIRKRILIVDDDRKIVQLIQKSLQEYNLYDFCVAFDGFWAGERFCQFKPDLMILDINMPVLDGISVLSHIRSNPSNRDVKIMIVTGTIEANDKAKVVSLGADEFLNKPFEMAELKQKVNSLLGEGTADVGNGV